MVGRRPDVLVALVIVSVLVVTGPVVGVDATRPQSSTFGEGTASVSAVDIETEALRITDGRFGTGVQYLRVPAAAVTVSDVAGRPRLAYVVSVPALELTLTAFAVVSSPSTYRLAPDDRALERTSRDGPYAATITVSVQSFTESKQVRAENVTVEVVP